MRKGSRALLLMSIWIVLTGIYCQGKRNNLGSAIELEVLVNAFHKECSKTGLSIDSSSNALLIGFGRIDSRAGSCKPNSNPKTITIDSLMWRALSPQQKEILVYHELAHCLLNVKHTNDTLRFGECKSWMREDDSICTMNFVNAEWREYYINELFAAETLPAPGWYNIHEKADPGQSATRVKDKVVHAKSNALQFDSAFFHSGKDWMIKINFFEPISINGSLGITINEYAIQLAVYDNNAAEPDTLFSRALMLNQYEFQRDKNILQWDILKSSDEKKEVTIKKRGKAVFIFFGDDLRSCIPIAGNKITFNGYAAFKNENEYSIRVYAL
jgi:Putative phage metallopeptidase